MPRKHQLTSDQALYLAKRLGTSITAAAEDMNLNNNNSSFEFDKNTATKFAKKETSRLRRLGKYLIITGATAAATYFMSPLGKSVWVAATEAYKHLPEGAAVTTRLGTVLQAIQQSIWRTESPDTQGGPKKYIAKLRNIVSPYARSSWPHVKKAGVVLGTGGTLFRKGLGSTASFTYNLAHILHTGRMVRNTMSSVAGPNAKRNINTNGASLSTLYKNVPAALRKYAVVRYGDDAHHFLDLAQVAKRFNIDIDVTHRSIKDIEDDILTISMAVKYAGSGGNADDRVEIYLTAIKVADKMPEFAKLSKMQDRDAFVRRIIKQWTTS